MNEALKRPLPCEQEERGRAKVEGRSEQRQATQGSLPSCWEEGKVSVEGQGQAQCQLLTFLWRSPREAGMQAASSGDRAKCLPGPFPVVNPEGLNSKEKSLRMPQVQGPLSLWEGEWMSL